MTFATVHGNQSIMEAAAAAKGDVKVLAVTVLTSLDRGDLEDLGFTCDVEKLVLSRARRALEAGCDGVVSSGLEAKMLRQFVDDRLIVVTPGIRPVENRPSDDQKRVVTVEQAFTWGADYIVVGRPIRDTLFASAGLADEEATRLVEAVLDWRDADSLRRANGAEEADYRAAGLAYRPRTHPSRPSRNSSSCSACAPISSAASRP